MSIVDSISSVICELNRTTDRMRFDKSPGAYCLKNVAGSINSYERLDEIKKINPASFTIGSAFFNQCFGSDFGAQIDTVCSYMEQ